MALLTPQYLQTQNYQAAKDRYLVQKVLNLTESGVEDLASLVVSQRAAGANRSVDVAAGDAWILGTDSPHQGAYLVTNDEVLNVSTTTTGVVWPVGDATNPRIDQVILRIFDTQDGSAANGNKSADNAQILVLVGVPTAGATLANRNGAAALPSSCARLADVLMPAGATAATTANISDRRPFATPGGAIINGVTGNISVPAGTNTHILVTATPFAGTGYTNADVAQVLTSMETVTPPTQGVMPSYGWEWADATTLRFRFANANATYDTTVRIHYSLTMS